MKRYKILVSDFDGTLASSQNKISEVNLSAINGFVSRGGIFVLSSGRATDGISKILLSQGFSGLLSSFNGAVLYDLNEKKILASKCVPTHLCLRFIDYATKNGLYYHLYGETGFYFPFETERTSLYERLTLVQGKNIENMYSFVESTCASTPKILVFDDKDKLDAHFSAIVSLLPECDVVRSTDNMIDINLKGVNKGSALDLIAQNFCVRVEDIIAVGDAGNDLAMIERECLSVAVANATEEIKAVAKVISPYTNDDNAVAHLIEDFCI
ncbi:MAG: HAD family phosphatase [Clostridia bacterium]|nr:HAD family phosphatase [Clostridia bacterium]